MWAIAPGHLVVREGATRVFSSEEAALANALLAMGLMD
jgi:hypothetical protein